MTWNNPATVSEMASSIRAGFTFHSTRFDVEAHAVHVLSGHPFTAEQRTQPLADLIATGAAWATDNYMNGTDRSKARTYHGDVVSYYLRDRRSGLALAGIKEDGTVMDEIAAIRPDLRPLTAELLRSALDARAARGPLPH